jgi:predicted RNA-binding Zn ribbon-like protein
MQATVNGLDMRGHHAHQVRLEDTFDFLNTDDLENGFPIERLPTLGDALSWFVDRGVIHGEGADRLRAHAAADPIAAERELVRIRSVRSALLEVADAIVEHRPPQAGALDTVNRALHARQVIELVPSFDGCVAVDHRHVGDPIDDALARLCDPLVQELTGGDPERIRICANDTCRWVFFDTSRTGRRRWCDMATCGNRAKAARHRARAKDKSVRVDASEHGGSTPETALAN